MTPNLPTVLWDCHDRGIQLIPHGDQLTIDGPQEALTTELIDALRIKKPAILHYLQNGEILLDAQTASVAEVRQALEFFKRTRNGNSDRLTSNHRNHAFEKGQ